MHGEKCPNCGRRIYPRGSILHEPNEMHKCHICKRKGCDHCFLQDKIRVFKLRIGLEPVEVCSIQCAKRIQEKNRTMSKPKKILPRKLKDPVAPDPVRWKELKELAELYFVKFDQVKRKTVQRFGRKNYYRVETWEIPDPEYHEDAPQLMFHEEVNDLLVEWGYKKLTREEIIILFSFNITEILVTGTMRDRDINRDTPMEDGIDLFLNASLKNRLGSYGKDRAYTGDIFSSVSLYQTIFTMWVFIRINYGVDHDVVKLLQLHDNYYFTYL
jgi:hypothetical protein